MAQNLEHLGIIDLDEKHAVVGHREGGGGPLFTLLWRTTGKRGRPLPPIGATLTVPGGIRVVVERIDPPGTTLELPPEQRTMIITPHTPKGRA